MCAQAEGTRGLEHAEQREPSLPLSFPLTYIAWQVEIVDLERLRCGLFMHMRRVSLTHGYNRRV